MLEHWQRATVSLGRLILVNGQQRYTTLGSAVLAAVDEHHGCILTAKHMVDDPTQTPPWVPHEIQLRLARTAASESQDMGVRVPLIVDGAPI
jgi:hypothetical protein